MKVLIVGKSGQLGREFARLSWRSDMVQLDRAACDLTDLGSVRRAVVDARAQIVVNAAAYTAVDRAEHEPDLAMRINSDAPAAMARACADTGAALIHVSTDYVFDGRKNGAYREDDATAPLSIYGQTKLAGERGIRENLQQHIILRTSWVFSSFGTNFVKTMLRLGSERGSVRVVNDQIGAPTAAADVARAIRTIVEAAEDECARWGTFHFSSAEPVSWYDFACVIFSLSPDLAHVKAEPISTAQFGAPARRPANSALDCRHIRAAFGIKQPSWRVSLANTLAELEARGV